MADETERTLVNLRLFPDELDALKKAAKEEDRSWAAMARRIVVAALRERGLLPTVDEGDADAVANEPTSTGLPPEKGEAA